MNVKRLCVVVDQDHHLESCNKRWTHSSCPLRTPLHVEVMLLLSET